MLDIKPDSNRKIGKERRRDEENVDRWKFRGMDVCKAEFCCNDVMCGCGAIREEFYGS